MEPIKTLKRCTKCLLWKYADEDFYSKKVNPNSTRTGDTFIDPVCKVCQREISLAQRRKNLEHNRALSRDTTARNLFRNRQFAWEYLKANPCLDCGETDVLVLEFDHVRGVKEFAIAVGIAKRYSIERLTAEIAKCDIRCANCHRRRTAGHMGWYANMLTVDGPEAA
jgi:hypothetical protein